MWQVNLECIGRALRILPRVRTVCSARPRIMIRGRRWRSRLHPVILWIKQKKLRTKSTNKGGKFLGMLQYKASPNFHLRQSEDSARVLHPQKNWVRCKWLCSRRCRISSNPLQVTKPKSTKLRPISISPTGIRAPASHPWFPLLIKRPIS